MGDKAKPWSRRRPRSKKHKKRERHAHKRLKHEEKPRQSRVEVPPA